MLQCLVETFTFAVDGRHFWGARQLAIASNAYLFAANISFALIWSVYVDYRLYHSLRRLRKCYPLIAIPAMLIMLGAVLNLFFPVFFVISKENVYSRTALANFAFGATYFYLIYSLWLVYRRRGKVEKYISMPVAVCMVPVFIGSLAQMFWYGVSLIWVSVAISLIALSGGLQSEEGLHRSAVRVYSTDSISIGISTSCSRKPSVENTARALCWILTGSNPSMMAAAILSEIKPSRMQVRSCGLQREKTIS